MKPVWFKRTVQYETPVRFNERMHRREENVQGFTRNRFRNPCTAARSRVGVGLEVELGGSDSPTFQK
jgi:hypothetical protein